MTDREDRQEGIKGRVKEAIGTTFGNDSAQREGRTQQDYGRAPKGRVSVPSNSGSHSRGRLGKEPGRPPWFHVEPASSLVEPFSLTLPKGQAAQCAA
ncbi:CsbD family protein [Amycolatopsis rhizosphaerae]|uniref:CsbD family protein n=1 Tax=Amycolatopsis rhizosphaerae TaxID=2053003 RepID=UPI001FED0314|nr:CsbD family protein [Amycolatopsis rhizosphaerae]